MSESFEEAELERLRFKVRKLEREITRLRVKVSSMQWTVDHYRERENFYPTPWR